MFFILPANRVVPNPRAAIRANESLKPANCAIKPIRGGPTRKPRNPMVETAAKALLADIVDDFPAMP